jgi:hypothetical protein
MAYDFDAVKRGWVKREQFPVSTVAPMQAFAFNIRRPQFQDPRVRRAFNLAFDFEWSNKNLFYDQYARVGSYFDNSELKAIGLPNGRELELLNELKTAPPVSTSEGHPRRGCRKHLGQRTCLASRLTSKNGIRQIPVCSSQLTSAAAAEAIVLLHKASLEAGSCQRAS